MAWGEIKITHMNLINKLKLKRMSNKEIVNEIDELIENKGPNRAFMVSTGESQRYWALKGELKRRKHD